MVWNKILSPLNVIFFGLFLYPIKNFLFIENFKAIEVLKH